jgi:hypothetical protein
MRLKAGKMISNETFIYYWRKFGAKFWLDRSHLKISDSI